MTFDGMTSGRIDLGKGHFVSAARQIAAWLPEGRPLPELTWQRRHRVILVLLWMHVACISIAALAIGLGPINAAIEGLIPASMALLAMERHKSRRFRATFASVGLASSSALLVHLSRGNIEMHFHFFVVVAVITLYQDWRSFLVTIALVALHHGVFGVIDPTAVYNHQDAWDHPWKWALIHALFVLAASVAGVVNWRLNEGLRELNDLILRAAGEGIYVLDVTGRIVFVNPAMSAMVGMDPLSIMSWSEQQLLDGGGDSQIDRPQGDVLPGSAVIDGTSIRHAGSTVVYRRDGTTFPADFVATPLLERGRPQGAVIALSDTSDRRTLEMQLAQSHKLEAIGQLAAGIAHEINTPTQFVADNTRFMRDCLTSLLAVVHAARDADGHADPQAQQALHDALDAADFEFISAEASPAIEQSLDGLDRISTIVGAMKEFSHPGSAEKTATDLNHAILNTIVVARNEWKYVAEVVTDLDPLLPPVPCLVSEVNQVILNLIINAAHAIGDQLGSTGEQGTITIRSRLVGDVVEVQVTDTGSGIPLAVRPRIFEPFFTTKEVGKGSGQGLALARVAIVERHGGDLRFETEEGVGTTFFVALPLETANRARSEFAA